MYLWDYAKLGVSVAGVNRGYRIWVRMIASPEHATTRRLWCGPRRRVSSVRNPTSRPSAGSSTARIIMVISPSRVIATTMLGKPEDQGREAQNFRIAIPDSRACVAQVDSRYSEFSL